MSAPELTVVVPTHKRRMRLRWLLNALEEQTLDPSRFEAIVVHDGEDGRIEPMVKSHPLAAAGALRSIVTRPAGPALKRNVGWRAARAPLIVFTDDDCRPPEEWLERMLAAAKVHPGAVVQGRTLPDPDEADVLLAAPHRMTQNIEPPTRWGQTCNIVYPRQLLDRLGGFDEAFPGVAGEDTDLLQRALKAGARQVGAPDGLTYHAVDARTLIGRVRAAARWGDLAGLIRRHPEMRRDQPFRIFWKSTHPKLLAAVLGLGMSVARREPWWIALVIPWARESWRWHGSHPRGVVRSLSELPGRAAIDATEIVGLARGSIRHRSLFL